MLLKYLIQRTQHPMRFDRELMRAHGNIARIVERRGSDVTFVACLRTAARLAVQGGIPSDRVITELNGLMAASRADALAPSTPTAPPRKP